MKKKDCPDCGSDLYYVGCDKWICEHYGCDYKLNEENVMCQSCGKRKATQVWVGEGGTLGLVHGMSQEWCEYCCVEAQLKYAENAAVRVPELKEKLRELRRKEIQHSIKEAEEADLKKLNVDEEMKWNIMSLDNGTMVDVPEEMRACNVKGPSEIESILKNKIEMVVERTNNNRDRCHLISLVMDSAVKQGLIQAWRGFRSEIHKEFIYEVQVSYPILSPRLYVSVPLLDKEW